MLVWVGISWLIYDCVILVSFGGVLYDRIIFFMWYKEKLSDGYEGMGFV